MEGTRHEKVALIIAAYVIGFITAFIAFGQDKPQTHESIVLITEEKAFAAPVQESTQTMVGFDEDGLYAITPAGERIISANRNVLSASALESTGLAGYFYNIIDAEPSRDGAYIYFCEQLTAESENCDAYVYALATDTLYRVTLDAQAYSPTIAGHNSMWGTQNDLTLSGAISINTQMPWILESSPEATVQ